MTNDSLKSLDSSNQQAASRCLPLPRSPLRSVLRRCRTRESLLQSLYADQRGTISAFGYLLITVIVAIGILAGVTTIRDQLVQELADFGLGLENLNQSYTVNATYANGSTWNAGYSDTPAGNDVPGSSATVSFTSPTPE